MGFIDFGVLEMGNDGDFEVERFSSVDKILSDVVVVDDIIEDVDEDGGDFGVVGDEFEGFFDGGRGGIVIDVEEVSGFIVVDFDDVYGGYGEIGIVDKVVDVIIEFDEV